MSCTVSKHRQQVPLFEFYPTYPDTCFVQGSATLIGEVSIDADTYIGNNVVIKGDLNSVQIGEHCQILDNCVIQTVHRNQDRPQPSVMQIKDRCVIRENCTLISCQIDRFALINSGSVICEGSHIGENSIIGANSVVPPN